jgi:hypothetical protein
MKSIIQYLEETLETPSERSQREYENELARQMSDEEQLAHLKEKKNDRVTLIGAVGLAGTTLGSTALYNKYGKKGAPTTAAANTVVPRVIV